MAFLVRPYDSLYPLLLPFFPQTYQLWLDRWTPHTASRWVFTVVLIIGFMLRIVLKQVRVSTD